MVTNDITGEESREMLFNIVDSAQLMAEYLAAKGHFR